MTAEFTVGDQETTLIKYRLDFLDRQIYGGKLEDAVEEYFEYTRDRFRVKKATTVARLTILLLVRVQVRELNCIPS